MTQPTPGDSSPKWEYWTRARAVRVALSLAGAAFVIMFLGLGGVLLLDPLFSAPSGPEKVIGSLMVVAAMILLVAAPLILLRLRRTWPWLAATAAASLAAAWFGLFVFWDSFPLSP